MMQPQFKPVLIRPVDFEPFWKATLRELEQIEPDITRSRIRHMEQNGLVLEEIAFTSLTAARIHGYLLGWNDLRERPLVVHSHGYNSSCSMNWSWARAGFNVLGVDIRGFGRSTGAVPVRSRHGYMLTGMESPERYVLRGAVCDYMRAVFVARELLGRRVSRTILYGISFGGALALMTEATIQVADLLAIGVPTFGWAEGRQFFVKSGSGSEINRFLAFHPEAAEDLMVVLRYFDPMNFAGLIRCPTLLGLGLVDEVVPVLTVRAIADQFKGPLEIMEFPVSHSESPEEELWERFEAEWIRLALSGIRRDLGATFD